jgi:Secretion system C-terminal sorting domain
MSLKYTFLIIVCFVNSGSLVAQNPFQHEWSWNSDSSVTWIWDVRSKLSLNDEILIARMTLDSIAFTKIDSGGHEIWNKYFNFNPVPNSYLSGEIGQDQDFNYYMTTYDCNLIKLDSAGNVLLNTMDTVLNSVYTSPGYNDPSIYMAATDNSGIYIIKTFAPTSSCCQPRVSYLLKYDFQYNMIWMRKIASANALNGPQIYPPIILDAVGNIHIVYDTIVPLSDYNYFRLAFKPNGDTLIYQSLMELDNWTNIFNITSQNEMLMADRLHPIPNNSSFNAVAIYKFNVSGSLNWSDTLSYHPLYGENAAGVAADLFGNTYLLSYDGNYNSNVPGYKKIRLRKFDPGGNINWTREWNGSDTIGAYNLSAISLNVFDDGIIITGTIPNIGSDSDAFIAMTDTSGNTIWQDTLSYTFTFRDWYRSVDRDICGNVYVEGYSDSSGIAMATYSKYSNPQPCFVNVNQPSGPENTIKIYPNPASSTLYIKLQLMKIAPINIVVLNILGQVVMSKKLIALEDGSASIEIDVQEWNSGVYYVRTEGFESQKLIIAR